MRLLRLSLCASLGLHGVAFAVLALGGLASRHADLPSAGSDNLVTITVIAAPDDPLPAPNHKTPVPAAIQLVTPQPSLLKPVKVSPDFPLPPLDPLAATPAPTESKQSASVPASTKPASPPTTTLATVAPPENHPRGDASSPEVGESPVTRQSTVGTRAQPDYRKNPEPLYPATARRRGQQGLVLLRVTVATTGNPARVEIKQSSGFPLLDQAALEAVRSWIFEPARIGALPITSEIEVPIRFKLSE